MPGSYVSTNRRRPGRSRSTEYRHAKAAAAALPPPPCRAVMLAGKVKRCMLEGNLPGAHQALAELGRLAQRRNGGGESPL